MVQAAIFKAKKLGAVEDVRHPIPEDELIRRGNVIHFTNVLGFKFYDMYLSGFVLSSNVCSFSFLRIQV